MEKGHRRQPQVLIWFSGRDDLIFEALKSLSCHEAEAAASNDGSMEESGCFTAGTLFVKWLRCSKFDSGLQENGVAGLPLPVIGCGRRRGIWGVGWVESPRQNDMLRLCVEDGLRCSGVICREAKDATEAKKRSEASFSPLAGTAVYLEVGNTDVADLARSIRLICGFLERRLDAVRCEIAQARNRIGSL